MSGLTRRQLLARSWGWLVGLVAVAGIWTSWDILRNRGAAGFGGEVRAVPEADVPDDAIVSVPEARAYLTKVDGEVRALWWKCPHLACRVPYCESSGQFECPCHGSVFNRAGDLISGPSPTGMDRFATEIVDGTVVVDTGTVIDGPAPGTVTIDEAPKGPPCLGGEE